ncbi:MAG: hypothetical protein R3B09_01425 [Nannocystaceae bacterium]
MGSLARRLLGPLVPLAMTSMTLVGCLDAGSAGVADTATTTGDATADASSGDGPALTSTLTGATTSSAGSMSGGGSEGQPPDLGAPEPVDEAPTLELRVNGEAEPGEVLKAGTQSITADVADDHGLARVEFYVDDAPAPFAEVDLDGSLYGSVAVGLPIYDTADNGARHLRAVVVDDARQATESATITLKVAVPNGGLPVWEVAGGSKFASKAMAAAADTLGDVIAVGEEWVSIDPHRSRMAIRKYHRETGELLWERWVPSQVEEPVPAGNNTARAVAVDADDNVWVVGEVRPDGMNRLLWVGRFTYDGVLVKTYVSALAMSRGNGVAVDETGRVFVVGYVRENAIDRATIDAFDVNLQWLWGDTLADVSAYGTRAYGAAVDRNGDVVVVGSNFANQDKKSLGLVALYTPAGIRSWKHVPSSVDPFPRDRFHGVAVDDDNRYVLVGRRQLGDDTRRLWVLSMGEGGQEFSSEFGDFAACGDLDFNNDTDACGVALGPKARTFVAGVSPANNDDFLVKKTASEGAINLWAETHDGADAGVDRALSVTSDADGFPIAAGYETHAGGPRWWIARYNP